MAEEENETEAQEEEAPKGGGMMKMIIMGVVGLALIGGGIALGPTVLGMFGGGDADGEEQVVEEPTSGPPIYQSLHPPMVVNFKDEAGDMHFMQVTMEVMSREQDVINSLRDNTAVVRNALIMLFSDTLYEEVQTRAGKEKMLADGLAEVQRVLEETTGHTGVEAVYFTALVIQ